MCLDRRAQRSLAAWRGWETRRARMRALEDERKPKVSPPLSSPTLSRAGYVRLSSLKNDRRVGNLRRDYT